ncbi:hypothetical protein AXX17_AT1G46120 [Arabidopsis thaliana]|uniref:Regulator of Vps4 activity in the MVB pathway protein n=1 Tax=Arabidopsis thaliana TaxID=3702 RepID=A0A178W0T7_ARATH|nr:hypothetical protein AXX17_AT1G46120 [Arabidopsis thaliana]
MFGFSFSRRRKSNAFTWKVLKQLQSRLMLLKSQKYAKSRHLRADIVDFIRSNDSKSAVFRTEQLLLVENAITIYGFLLKFTDFILLRFSPSRKHSCLLVNDDTSEAVSNLIFASVKCREIPELLIISELVGQRYGQRYVTTAIQVPPGNLVNTEIKEKLKSTSVVSETDKCRVMEEIAKESGYRLEILGLGYKSEIDNEVFDLEEKNVMDESLHEVYKFCLTDVDERSKKETSMKDDYIEDKKSTRLLAENAKKSGHSLEILRPESKPETEKEVNEEEEKRVMDPDVDISCYEESPHEVYKFSLTDFEEEIMEDDYREDMKCRMLDDIVKNSGHRVEISRPEYYKPEIEKQVYEKEEKKVMDPDIYIRSYEESPNEVYKFSLTDLEEEIMENDSIEGVKCRMLDEIMKKSGHHLKISRPEYKPEIEKQVYEEEEKKVMDPDVDIRCYEESPHEVSKFSLTDFEEEIMEDDYIEALKCRMLDDILKKSGHRLEISRRQYNKPEIEIQVNEEEEKKVINTDMDIRYDDESPEEVEKYSSLTDDEEERSKEDTSMEDVKCRMLDKNTTKLGHLLGISRPEYRPEIEKQVNEEKEKKVMDIRSAGQSQHEVYKFSLTDIKEERSNEDSSMEDCCIEEAQVGKDQRVFRFRESSEEKRKSSSSPLSPLTEFRDMESLTYYMRQKRMHRRRRRSSTSPHCCHNVVYNEFKVTKEEEEEERQRLTTKRVHSKLHEYEQFLTQFKKKKEEENERRRLSPKDFEPTPPDYDQVITRFRVLEKEEEERQRLATKHVHPKLPDYDQIATKFKLLKEVEKERRRLLTKHSSS